MFFTTLCLIVCPIDCICYLYFHWVAFTYLHVYFCLTPEWTCMCVYIINTSHGQLFLTGRVQLPWGRLYITPKSVSYTKSKQSENIIHKKENIVQLEKVKIWLLHVQETLQCIGGCNICCCNWLLFRHASFSRTYPGTYKGSVQKPQ